MSSALPLSPQVFAILSALIEERLGLHYDVHESDLLAERVSPRAIDCGFDSLLDYYYFLRYDPGAEVELAILADGLVVNETYFFREATALRVLVTDVVPELIAAGARPRIWCAACSTGEEALTLAMLLDEAGLLDQVTLVASDLSARALAQAKEAVYRRRSLRSLPPGVGRWLEGDESGMRAVPHIAGAVDWRRINLLDERDVSTIGHVHIVICRNVLIYFRDQTIERVVAGLRSCLLPKGVLVVGASESLLRFNVGFACEERGGAFLYRKVEQ